MFNAYSDTPGLHIPDAFPWGIALISLADGALLHANAHMREHYMAGGPCEGQLGNFFGFVRGMSYPEVAAVIVTGQSWSGRVEPLKSQHGISSVELMIHQDPKNENHAWIYTLEHPEVDGTVRFSSRSEIQLLQVLLDNTLEYVFFRDLEGRFILSNKAFQDAVSADSAAAVVGQTIDDFVLSESASWVRNIDERVLLNGVPSVNNVAKFYFNNGTKHWLQMSTVPVRGRAGAGEIVGSVSVARDISDLKRTESELRDAIEEAKAASRTKGEFLAAMSHEIRTPINGIIGASELCQETRLDPEQRSYLETVVQCGGTLLTLVNDVLDFSKIEAGQMNLEKLNFSPASLLEDVIDEFAQVVRKKGVELILDYDQSLPRYMMGDPTRLKQILYNLVGNAVKFTERGEIVLRTETLEHFESGALIRFSVKDTGIGISQSRMDAIFSSFTQEDMSTTRKYGGTGLGLAICRELVDLMHGTITVESAVGKGSTFKLEVPFEITQTPGIEAIPYNSELAGLRVLVVDDNATNRDIYKQMCAGWGYRAVCASSGPEALRLLEDAAGMKEPFKLILLDQQMPGINGLDLVSLIDARRELRGTKVLLLSSSLNKVEAERAETLGVARTLSKPVKRTTLIEVILETFGVNEGASKAETSAAPEAPQPPEGAKLEVLLAEDNLVNQNIAKRRLMKLGHHVTVVPNGQEAIEQVYRKRFDCILMDIQMPGMDGYETTQEIRRIEMEEGMQRHFIVAMTAHAMKGDAEKCLAAGMDEYMSKPFRAERLQEVLDMGVSLLVDSEGGSVPSGPADQLSFAKRLSNLSQDDREDLLGAAKILVKSLPADIAKFREALEADDLHRIYFMAHTLKGVAGIFDDQEIVELGGRIETACDKRDLTAAITISHDFISRLKAMSNEVRIVLDSEPDGVGAV